MQVKTVLIALALGLLVACGGRGTRTVEIDPEGVNRAPANARRVATEEPGWLSRAFGAGDQRQNIGACPLMGVLYDNARVVKFQEAGREAYANIAYTGEIRGVRGLCRYVGTDPIQMAIEINMAFGKGPAGTADRQNYRYWVAVTRRGTAPIEKQYFDVEARFNQGPVTQRLEQIENIVIPRANGDVSGENFEILVGFDLTPEQLQFNRDGKRFRVGLDGRQAATTD